ncbi:MAG: TonB-dependent receptor [Crocinitomicaceae bacterium]|nr:TonB-dependent receptor [Crocinitomicaceae bacterium]
MRELLIILFLSSSFIVSSQVITGKVMDEEGALEFASIRLFNPEDSTVTYGIFTSEDGSFRLDEVKPGNYYLKITFTNFADYVVDPFVVDKTQERDLGEIKLEIDKALEIDGVFVDGSLDVLKAGIDKKIYKVQDDITSKGGTVNDVLNNIPSIEVDQDGNISLRGDANVTILIDGRPSGLVLGDGQNLLNSLPANAIERVEVVTNPSAKYDPDGTSGIINIVMKKNKLKGFNGIVSATAATGNQFEGNFSLSYRNERFNSYINYSFNYYEGYRNFSSDLTRDITADSSIFLSQRREGTDLKQGNSLVLGTDFYVNDRNVIGISATAAIGQRDRYGYLKNELFDGDNGLYNKWDRESFEPRSNRNLDVNLNYTLKFKKQKGEWSISAYQSFGDKSVVGIYKEIYYDDFDVLSTNSPLNQQLDNVEVNSITTAQTDYSYILTDINARIEAGAKMIQRHEDIDTYSEAMDTVTGLFNEDTLANFQYLYTGSEYSTYFIFGQELGKFKYQGGLRGEFAVQNPQLISSDTNYRRTYINIFPSVHLKYEVSNKSEFGLSYSRRINRPRSRQLNPFVSYADPFNLRSGNPELKPEYIDSYDFSYSFTAKKLIISTSVFHKRTTDVINRVKYFCSDNTAFMTYANIDKSVSAGLEVILIYKPFKWMKNTLSFNGSYIDYTNYDSNADWNNDGLNWGVKYSGSVDFWKKTASFKVTANYSAPRVVPQGVFQRGNVIGMAFEKRLFKNKLSIGTRVTDLFNTMNTTIKLDRDGVMQDMEFKWLSRRVYLTLSYKFGQLDKKKMPRTSSVGGGD